MTRIVTGLEQDGLVQRVGDAHDRRLTRIRATPKGQNILAAGRARRVEKLAAAVTTLGSSELAELTRGVQLLGEIIGSMRGDRIETRSRSARKFAAQRRQRSTG
jgi:DNA-binding MarR family transcriptional regulator